MLEAVTARGSFFTCGWAIRIEATWGENPGLKPASGVVQNAWAKAQAYLRSKGKVSEATAKVIASEGAG
jgi:hypothetical protein